MKSKFDFECIVHMTFTRYVRMAKEVIRIFKVEPQELAGVWALHKFHFLPFILGAS